MAVVGGWGGTLPSPVGVVGGFSPPLWVWLGLGGMKRHDFTSPLSPVGVGGWWVWVSQMEELRKPFLNLYGMATKP